MSRIARDQLDILERMQAGAFTSVREAAREAGMIKDVSLVKQVLRLWQRATPEERQAIRQGLEDGALVEAQPHRGRPPR